MKIVLKINLPLFILVAMVILANSFAHAAADMVAPSVPGTPATTVTGSGEITVAWGASTDSVGVAGYYVYRNGAQVAGTASLSYVDKGLSAGLYVYTIAAYDAAGNVSSQGPQKLVTPVIDTTAPSVPAGLSAVTTYRPPKIVLSWTASTDNMSTVLYYVYRDGTRIWTSSAITTTSYTDTDILAGNTYSYTIVAYDPAANSSVKSSSLNVTITIDTAAPSVPVGVSAMATSSSAIAVYWASSTDNVGVTGYYVYRNGIQVGNVASSTSLSYTNSGIPIDTYNYTVAAYDLAGNVSNRSFPVNVTMFSDVISPIAPTGLSGIVNSTSQISLSWNVASDNIGVIGYSVYRNDAKVTDVNKNFYIDTDLAASTTYKYAVKAYDVSGNISTSSIPVIIATPKTGSAQLPQTNTAATSTNITSATSTNLITPTLTYSLSRGARISQVRSLQDILIKIGYLGADSNTGYFGPLTEKAVQKFQCDNNIVCSSANADWGVVDGKTRDVLNSISGNDVQNIPSTAQLTAQIQALQALLANLLLQVQALHK